MLIVSKPLKHFNIYINHFYPLDAAVPFQQSPVLTQLCPFTNSKLPLCLCSALTSPWGCVMWSNMTFKYVPWTVEWLLVPKCIPMEVQLTGSHQNPAATVLCCPRTELLNGQVEKVEINNRPEQPKQKILNVKNANKRTLKCLHSSKKSSEVC